MTLQKALIFLLGILLGAAGMFVANRFLDDDRLARKRLNAYEIFMSYYADRNICLSLGETAHRNNEALVATLKLVGPKQVGRLAEEHYLTCGQVRSDARNARVPADWYTRRDHSWSQFDQGRLQLVAQMVQGLPGRYQANFNQASSRPAPPENRQDDNVTADQRKR